MPFLIRPHRRFPLCCPVTYNVGLSEGSGTIWNISLTGWRLSSDLPLQVGQSFTMTVTLPDRQSLFVEAGIVRWVHGEDYGVETLVVEKETQSPAEQAIKRLIQA
jgi:hypothetical protein